VLPTFIAASSRDFWSHKYLIYHTKVRKLALRPTSQERAITTPPQAYALTNSLINQQLLGQIHMSQSVRMAEKRSFRLVYQPLVPWSELVRLGHRGYDHYL